jgi:hypothetical protein
MGEFSIFKIKRTAIKKRNKIKEYVTKNDKF